MTVEESLAPPAASSLQILLDSWRKRHSGQIHFIYPDRRRILFLRDGQVVGCYSTAEQDEPRMLLLKGRHPAVLILESLRSDPAFDPFLPLSLIENEILTFSEFITLLRHHAETFIYAILAADPNNWEFSPTIPDRPIFIPIDPFLLIRSFINDVLPREQLIEEMRKQGTIWSYRENADPLAVHALMEVGLDVPMLFHEPRNILEESNRPEGMEADTWERNCYLLFRLEQIFPDKSEPLPAVSSQPTHQGLIGMFRRWNRSRSSRLHE